MIIYDPFTVIVYGMLSNPHPVYSSVNKTIPRGSMGSGDSCVLGKLGFPFKQMGHSFDTPFPTSSNPP